jgi:hypothetical protein
MTDKQDVRMVPVELDDEMIRVSRAEDWPATYRTHLRHPDEGNGQAAKTEALIARERKRWSAMLAAAPSVQPDREVIERLTKFANSLTGEFSSVVMPAKVAKQAAEDIRAALTVQPDGWRDISTAPDSDHKPFVVQAFSVRTAGGVIYTSDPVCVWRNLDGSFARWKQDFAPTHWMPLPAPPAALQPVAQKEEG